MMKCKLFWRGRTALGMALLAGLGFALAGWPLQAQSGRGTIRGRVESEGGQPVPAATIQLHTREGDFLRQASPGAEGEYEFSKLPAGGYRLSVHAPGYDGQVRERVQVSGGKELEVDFRLRARRTTLREVEERGSRERNPNIFIRKVDLNALRDPLRRRGIDPLFLQFTAAENFHGTDMGTPLRQILFVKPQEPENRLHGSLYETHQNSVLNARPFFNVGDLRPSKLNQFGFSAVGPLKSDRLSFGTSLELIRESGFVNGNIRSPLAVERTPTTSDPEARAIVLALLEAFPPEDPNLPGVAPRQLNTNAIRRIESLDWNFRLDYALRDDESLAFQYTLFDYAEDPFELVAGENPKTDLRPQTFSATHQRAWSAATVTQSSFQFERVSALLALTDRFRSLFEPLGFQDVPEVDFGGNQADLNHIGPGTQFPRERFQNRFSGNFDFAQQRGRHRWRFGGRTTRTQLNDLQSDNSRGSLLFTSNFGRTAVENFLEGTPTRFTITLGDLYRGFRNWEHAFYLQDTYQVRSDLSMTLGVRYEIVTAPVEVDGRTEIAYDTDANNLAPQVAFAWAPKGGRTVVRAGYGIAFGHIFAGTYQLARFNPPAVQTLSVQNPSLSDPLAGVDLSGEQRPELSLLSPDLVSPYAHQYNLLIQRRLPRDLLFEVGYVGNRTHKLPFPFVSNRAEPVPGVPATIANIDDRRPDPRFLRVQTIINSGTFFYDGLKTGLRGSLGQGVTLDVNYVFSKSLSNSSDFVSTLNREIASLLNQHNENFHADLRGPSPFDHRHILGIQYAWELPFRFQEGFPGALLQGWQISGVTQFHTGLWYRIKTSSDAPGFGNVDGERDDRVNLTNPDILGETMDDPDTVGAILNPAFFNTDIEPGGGGNSPYFGFRRDRLNNTNVALTKSFAISRRERLLQFRAEFLNLFNRAWFERPGDIFPSQIFGKIIDTQNKGRVIQFMLRLNF